MSEFHPEHDIPGWPQPAPLVRPAQIHAGRKYDHETILKTYINRKAFVRLEMMDGGHNDGRISQFDKWTITMVDHSGLNPETFFKHAIRSFKQMY